MKDDVSYPICPITMAELIDPVVDPEGFSYEREAIVEWLKDHSTSPITRTPLSAHQLVPNRALKELIARLDEPKQQQDVVMEDVDDAAGWQRLLNDDTHHVDAMDVDVDEEDMMDVDA